MNTLTNSSQSSVVINSESSIPPHRPAHNPPKTLSSNEVQDLYKVLGNNCVSLATAVVQILHEDNHIWKKQACGILCFVKDYNKRMYCLRLYDLRLKQSIYEESVPSTLRLEKMLDLFYTFNGMNSKVGINFVDVAEAQIFCKHFHTKQENRQKNKSTDVSVSSQQTSDSSVINEMKIPTNSTIKMSVPMLAFHKTSKKQSTLKLLKSGKKKDNRPVISDPVPLSLVHVIHVAHNESFVSDDTHRNLFEEVLASMNISPDEKSYVRKAIIHTNGGLGKLFTGSISKPTHDYDTEEKQMSNSPPSTYPETRVTNGKRVSVQDISVPSLIRQQSSENHSQLCYTSTISNQSTVPPRPSLQMQTDTQSVVQTVPSSAHPLTVLQQATGGTPTLPSDSESNSLFKEIRTFDTVKLKPATDRTLSSAVKSSLATRHTLEMNIYEMIKQRRIALMGQNDDHYENNSSDDEYSA